VEAHGGSIRVEHTFGGGATFVVVLPARPAKVDGVSEPASEPEAQRTPAPSGAEVTGDDTSATRPTP
jgi:hypothetical protein